MKLVCERQTSTSHCSAEDYFLVLFAVVEIISAVVQYFIGNYSSLSMDLCRLSIAGVYYAFISDSRLVFLSKVLFSVYQSFLTRLDYTKRFIESAAIEQSYSVHIRFVCLKLAAFCGYRSFCSPVNSSQSQVATNADCLLVGVNADNCRGSRLDVVIRYH